MPPARPRRYRSCRRRAEGLTPLPRHQQRQRRTWRLAAGSSPARGRARSSRSSVPMVRLLSKTNNSLTQSLLPL